MQSVKRAVLYGIGVWLLLVVVSSLLFSLEKRDDTLFESVKFVSLATIVVGFFTAYLRPLKKSSLNEGIMVGALWSVMTVVLDLGLYTLGLFNLSLFDYFKDVASSYIVMPILGGIMMGALRGK
ncbi:MAG TPA: hypothetical protein VFZ58_05350 [Candidatus Saccharimonadales bacterium]